MDVDLLGNRSTELCTHELAEEDKSDIVFVRLMKMAK
jgi:hypothetical protein